MVGAQAATYTVINTNDGGDGSLRWALTNANAGGELSSITFNIATNAAAPPFTVNLASALPPILSPVILDGTTQPGFAGKPVVVLNGAAVPAANGLTIAAGGTTVRGLVLQNFAGYGIAATAAAAGSNTIQCCFIGTDASGTVAQTNLSGGIHIGAASDNLIGGTNALDGNVISGNANDGIWIDGTPTSFRNTIVGNWIGTTWGGSNALGNVRQGIRISSGQLNVVGGSNDAARNIISGNGESGVTMEGARATNNAVLGNYLGLNGTGTAALANGQCGVRLLNGAQFNQVGGTNAGEGNVISGNMLSGVDINTGAQNNRVAGNLIGTSKWGTNAVPNGQAGVAMSTTTNNLIGGAGPGARNVISGNSQSGVYLTGTAACNNQMAGNYIGVDATGTKRLGNGYSGVWLTNASANCIGTGEVGGGNVISGNGFHNVYLQGNGAFSNSVLGNYIGTDSAGMQAIWSATTNHGVIIDDAPANTIGGTTAGARNLISGNYAGILLVRGGAIGNAILGNYVGTTASGMGAIGNFDDAIKIGFTGIAGSPANTLVGGAAAGAGNVIAGGNYRGINVNLSTGALIQGNRIGVGADGATALMNMVHNIDVQTSASATTIGGTNSGEGNVIAYAPGDSGWDGVRIRSGVNGTKVLANSIYLNGGSNPNGLGIDIGPDGVSLNDPCDSDYYGPAHIQNYPILTNAISDGISTVVRGLLEGNSGQGALVQFYANPAPDASGYGEGQKYLGAGTVMLLSCTNTFAFTLPAAAPSGWMIAATATDAANNTSEFSPNVAVGGVPQVTLQSGGMQQATLGWLVTNAYGGTWQLTQATNLTPPVVWSNVTNTPTVLSNGTWFTVTLDATNDLRFYRLRYQ
jgi:titin